MANIDRTINYIELPLVDVAATKAFYETVFGWGFTDYGPDYVAFDGAGVDGGFNRENAVTPAGSGTIVVLYADDLEATAARVRGAGATVHRDIYAFPGGRRFHFTDPNGSELAVWSEV